MSLRKLRFSVFVIKTYSGTGKRDFNLGLCFCFFRFCSLPRALTSALIPWYSTGSLCREWLLTRFRVSALPVGTSVLEVETAGCISGRTISFAKLAFSLLWNTAMPS